MATLIVTADTKADVTMLSQMLKRMNFKAKIVSEDEKEDYAFGKMIDAGMKTKSVSRESVMKALKK